MAILLAGYFLYRVKKQLAENNKRINDQYLSTISQEETKLKEGTKTIENLLSQLLIDRWKKDSSKNPAYFALLWSHYQELRGGDCCSKRVLLMLFFT